MTHPLSHFFIELPQTIPGLEHFIGSWIIPGPPTIVVDVGPTASVAHLIAFLTQRGIKKVDYVWLTHIHIDHAGGLAPFLAHFPTARVVSHAKGLKHLIDPGKLWEGSLATLREMALAYQPISPVSADRLISHEAARLEGLTILETPGHAPHHLSFCYQDVLFSGESAGVYLPYWDKIYLRPPTPPRFFLEQAIGSVDQMLALQDQPIFFAHAGCYPSSQEILKLYRGQLYLWKERIAEVLRANPTEVLERATDLLLEKDPLLECFQHMDEPAQKRERFFMANSIAGFVGYLQQQVQ
jgi:glyoxylase-like metal-dependent hydrolase (beta-lactamase superfamily II)